jgi:glycine dehydrogenase subunit 1
MAIRACIYLAAVGPMGLREVATLCTRKAHYLAEQLTPKTDLRLAFPDVPFFKEFTVRLPKGKSIESGVALSRFGMDDLLTIAVTEKRTKAELDRLVERLRG